MTVKPATTGDLGPGAADTGQNLRHNIDDPMGLPAAGTTAVDGTLTYPPATTAATGVTAAAYTNVAVPLDQR